MSTVEQRQATLRSVDGTRHTIVVGVSQEAHTKPDSRFASGLRDAGSRWRVDHQVVRFKGRTYVLVTPLLSAKADNIAYHERPVLDLDQAITDYENAKKAARPSLRCQPRVRDGASPDDPERVVIIFRRDTGEELYRWSGGLPDMGEVDAVRGKLYAQFDAEYEKGNPLPVVPA